MKHYTVLGSEERGSEFFRKDTCFKTFLFCSLPERNPKRAFWFRVDLSLKTVLCICAHTLVVFNWFGFAIIVSLTNITVVCVLLLSLLIIVLLHWTIWQMSNRGRIPRHWNFKANLPRGYLSVRQCCLDLEILTLQRRVCVRTFIKNYVWIETQVA